MSAYLRRILMPAVFILLLISTRIHSYLLFHSLAELFSIFIAIAIFLLSWNARRFISNNYILFLGIAFLFIGIIDTLHTLAYKGMNIFAGFDTNLPTQLWIIGRYIFVFSLLIAPIFIKRKMKKLFVIHAYVFVTAILLLSVFVFRIFPVSYIEGMGLTLFKKLSEYIISVLLIVVLFIHFRNKGKFDQKVFKLLVFSIVTSILSELSFTLYVDVYGIFNLAGHILKLFAYFGFYKAIIEIGLSNPYNLLFFELKEKQKQMVILEKRKDEFISIASHELKTPVTTIKAFAEILQNYTKKNKDIYAESLLGKMNSQINRLVLLVGDLLDVQTIESGKMRFTVTPFDLSEMVKEVVDNFKLIKNTNHQIYFRGGSKLIINGDRFRVSQVVSNLINNAIKYSPNKDKILVTVKREKGQVRVEVQDFGIGIAKNMQDRIFDKFVQAHNRPDQGRLSSLGLGLFISSEIVQRHRGRIGCISDPGKGSTFHFSLPLKI